MVSALSRWIRLKAVLVVGLAISSCSPSDPVAQSPPSIQQPDGISKINNNVRVIHVLVALCDNANQGIVPVPARLGNGADPDSNLYWGAAFGVKTFFSKSKLTANAIINTMKKTIMIERV